MADLIAIGYQDETTALEAVDVGMLSPARVATACREALNGAARRLA